MRDVSISGLEQIGMGVSGEIFRYEDDKVLKLFRENYALPQVQRAYDIARFISEGDIPSPKVYELVECSGRYGIISEFIDASSLQISIYKGETGREEAGVKMGKLLRKVHALKSASFIPPQREMVGEIYDRCGDLLPSAAKTGFLDFLDSFPGKGYVLHGDFHENNIMVRKGEFILIDLDSLCIGSPLFEFQQSFTVYRAEIPEDWKEKVHYTDEEAAAFIKAYLGSYFDTDDEKLIGEYDRIFTKLSALNMFVAKILQAPENEREAVRGFVKENLPRMEKLVEEAPEDFKVLPW